MTRGVAAAIAVLAAAPGGALAEPVSFLWPVDCARGEECLVQQYIDLDPGPGVRDPFCGARSYDGHKGLDIRLISFADLAREVAVLAAADGEILRLRNDAPDARFEGGAVQGPPTDGAECGNGIVIRHAGGFETQYCHLKRGSVSVSPGEQVRAGARIGVIGLSGVTEFPHLEIIFRRDGAPVSPFTGAAASEACGGGRSLWAEPIAYAPVALLDAGFSGVAPRYAEARSGALGRARPQRDDPALTAWARVIGVAQGDQLAIEITGPDGDAFARHAMTLDRDRAVQFLFAGKRNRGLWPAGRYAARITLQRGDATLIDAARALELR